MNDPKDKKPADSPLAGPDTKRSGRVGRDARGNAVWEWETATGVFGQDVSTQRLKKLEAHELAFLETTVVKKPDAADADKPAAAKKPATPAIVPNKAAVPVKGSGFNPYDTSKPAAGANPYDRGSVQPTLVEGPAAKRRSIQSIVADQKSRDKK